MRRYLSFILLTAFILTAGSTSALAADNWGLSFPTPGEKPIGNASAEALLEHDAYYVDPTEEKVIYLTFDAGYENGNTEPILDALKEAGASSAFFLVGTYIRDNPDLIRRMVEEGHIVANHTMNHPNMSAISDMERFRTELEEPERIYAEITGKEMPKLYRPPQGKYSVENLKMAKELGYKTMFWSLAYVDWIDDDQPSKEQAFGKLLPRVHPGAIILLHNTSATNAAIMGELLAEYQSMGYRFRCLTEFGQ